MEENQNKEIKSKRFPKKGSEQITYTTSWGYRKEIGEINEILGIPNYFDLDIKEETFTEKEKVITAQDKLNFLKSIDFPTDFIGKVDTLDRIYNFFKTKEEYIPNQDEEVILNLYDVAKYYTEKNMKDSCMKIEEFETEIQNNIEILKSFQIKNYA